jgi:hypothetical protein
MATEKSSPEAAKTLNDSQDSAQNGSKASAAKSNELKPGAKVGLGKIDPAFKRKHESKDSATREI